MQAMAWGWLFCSPALRALDLEKAFQKVSAHT